MVACDTQVVTAGTAILVPYHSRKVTTIYLKIRYRDIHILLTDNKIVLGKWGDI